MGSYREYLSKTYMAHKYRIGALLENQTMYPTLGSYWWVNAEYGTDANSGDSIDHPVKTIQKALTLCAAKRTETGKTYDDYIFLMPTNGVDYDDDTVSASLTNAYVYINIPNVHLVGMGNPGEVIINPAAAASAGAIAVGASGDRFHLDNVWINTATALGAAVKYATGADYTVVENCLFDLVGTTGPTGYGIDMATGKVSYPVIRNVTMYLGTLMVAGIAIKVQDATPYGGLIKNVTMINVLNGAGTPVVDCINVMDGTGLIIDSPIIHGGDAGSNYNAADGIDIDAGVLNTLVVNPRISSCDALITDGGTDSDIVAGITADGEGGEFADAEINISAA
jgi:hypothetical protein